MHRSDDEPTNPRSTPPDDEPTNPRHGDDGDDHSFGEPEPTHLITFEDEADEETALITFDDHASEATQLITFDDDDDPVSDSGVDTSTDIRITDPTLPTEPDRAQELPRHITNQGDKGSPSLTGFQSGSASEFDFHQSATSFDGGTGGDDISLDLELDDRDFREREADSTDKTSAPSADDSKSPRRLARNLSVMVRDRARTHFAEVLQSPLRAMLIAGFTATLVLGLGLCVIYSALAHAHIDGQVDRIERAVDADLYSSHLAALRDLHTLSEHQVLPLGPIDSAIGGIVDLLPFLGTDEETARSQDLQIFVQARLDYRFGTPGDHLKTEPEAGESELLTAAAIYRLLSIGDTDAAVALAEEEFARGTADSLATLASGDALPAAGSSQQITLVADNFPDSTAAEAFIGAQLNLRLEENGAAREQLRFIVDNLGPSHVGAALELAVLDQDYDSVVDFTDADHDHASAVEQARALVITANSEDDEDARHRRLLRASERASLHPDAVSPFIDSLLQRGELIEARRHLARTPSAEFRHPYFDVAMARIHLLIGDHDRAEKRLKSYAFDDPEATAMLGVARAGTDDFDEAIAYFDAVADDDETLGTITRTWLDIMAGDDDKLSDLIALVDDAELSPYFAALAAETMRRSAAIATDSGDRIERIGLASSFLAAGTTAAEEAPETRLQDCLIALDDDNDSRARTACSLLANRDVASRPALKAAIRWHLSQAGHNAARELVDTHLQQTGPHPDIDLLKARIDIAAGNTERARATLDDLPSSTLHTADHLLVEAEYALQTQRLDRAAHYFSRARETSAAYLPEAVQGDERIADIQRQLDEAEENEDSP